MQEIQQKVFEIIASQMDADASQIRRDQFLSQDLGMDDLDRAELTMSLEEEFDISIPDDDADACKTVDDVIKLVENNIH